MKSVKWFDSFGRRKMVNSDLFHESVPDSFIIDVFNIMYEAKHHIFQVLTKRPERMRDFLIGTSGSGMGGELMPNVWFGVSVEDQATADERIPVLLQIPAAVRWISAEPLLGPIDLFRKPSYIWKAAHKYYGQDGPITGHWPIHWIVVGGESGPQARPMHPDWVRLLRDECRMAGVPFFFKQWGEFHPFDKSVIPDLGPDSPAEIIPTRYVRVGKKAAGRVLDGRTWDEYPNDVKN